MNIILILILAAILMILAWAIFSNRSETALPSTPTAEKEQIDEPEKILRRRSADRAIEKEFPVEKLESETHTEHIGDREDISGQIRLPFSANEIISDRSRFRLYKRALINSEIYAKRGDIETAISLFKGVKERILDDDIRSKIESNINYLNRFRHRRDEDFKKRTEASLSMQHPGELRLKIDGPVPQTINIGVPEKKIINSDEIINKLSEQIAKEIGTLKTDIEKLKSKPEDKFDIDDLAGFSNLQHELNSLKTRIEELTEERSGTLKELDKLREQYENEIEKPASENSEILNDIRKEIDNLSQLKHSLDSLHNKVEDISSMNIPESLNRPTIIQAKYDAPIPVHFDPKPVLEILDKLNQYKKEEKDDFESFDIPEEIKTEDHTIEELEAINDEPPEFIEEEEEEGIAGEKEVLEEIKDEELFPIDAVPVTAEDETDEINVDDLTTLEAEEFINEGPIIEDEEKAEDEALFLEPETHTDENLQEINIDEELEAEQALFEEPEIITAENIPDESGAEELESKIDSELSDDEIDNITKDETPPFVPDEIIQEKERDNIPVEETQPDETIKPEKEKEIEKYTDAEEDPNDFDLLSDIGKVIDDSTLTDDDIFEKILKEDKKKNDDSDFEIIGDIQKDEQEFSFNDSILDGKKKAEQDFYRKFIKADRIKKRELPILKVSYDFKKLPDQFSLSREKNILEYSFYKYKPMLSKADEYIKQKKVKDAINYYKVVLDQNIPIEFKAMIKRNIRDLTEYLEKYLSAD